MSGLPAIVGHLRGRGLPEEATVALIVPWAREHFRPPLADEEVEKQVRGMFRRYGQRPERAPRAPVVIDYKRGEGLG